MGFSLNSDDLPDGFEDLGDVNDLVPTEDGPRKASDLVNAQGQPVIPEVVPKVKPAPVIWQEDKDRKGQFFPILQLTADMAKMGENRPFKEFMPGERLMFAAAFTSDVTAWLFGEPLYLENFEDDATEFIPNPAFHELPTQTPNYEKEQDNG